MMSFSKFRCCTLIVLLLLVGALFFGASVVHFAYRIGTSQAEKAANTKRYHDLASMEMSETGSELGVIQTERMKLYYWFHARGWAIDEDEESQSRPWQDLLLHWRNGQSRP